MSEAQISDITPRRASGGHRRGRRIDPWEALVREELIRLRRRTGRERVATVVVPPARAGSDTAAAS